jgi:type IV pilus assembly protein PilE
MNKSTLSKLHNQGFTLIEVMIVVAIIAILSAIAIPSYQEYIKTSRRGAAAGCMLELAQQMERRFTTNLKYNTTTTLPELRCTTELSSFYTFALASGLSETSYVITAAPSTGQDDSICRTLTLNHRTLKGYDSITLPASLNAETVKRCWK